MPVRIESDFLGEREIPNDVYYGVQTLRGIENFKITGLPVSLEPFFVQAFGYVKKAAALANRDLGVLDPKVAEAIVQACDRLIAGEFLDQFPSDMIQGGAGTTTNMNANEVIANIALEALGHKKGEYQYVSPNDHVNCSQSTNDAYPTAFRIALIKRLESYSKALAALRDAFGAKGEEFASVLKMGRTHLQDAVPMSMGDEFHGFATNLDEELARIEDSKHLLAEVNMGATAIGTSVNAPPGYPELVVKYLCEVTGLELKLATDLVEATSDTGAYVQLSGVIKRTAVKLSKICNDLRLLASGPRAGFNEINLPQLQPGSSIMPGKVNPVIPEATAMVAAQVIGNDAAITVAGQSGNFELNVMLPVIAHNLLSSIELMANSSRLLADKAIASFKVNEAKLKEALSRNPILVTALNPIIGYQKAAEIAKTAYQQGRPVIDVALEYTDLSRSQLEVLLDPEKLTAGGV